MLCSEKTVIILLEFSSCTLGFSKKHNQKIAKKWVSKRVEGVKILLKLKIELECVLLCFSKKFETYWVNLKFIYLCGLHRRGVGTLFWGKSKVNSCLILLLCIQILKTIYLPIWIGNNFVKKNQLLHYFWNLEQFF